MAAMDGRSLVLSLTLPPQRRYPRRWGGSQLDEKLNFSRKEDGPNSTKKPADVSELD